MLYAQHDELLEGEASFEEPQEEIEEVIEETIEDKEKKTLNKPFRLKDDKKKIWRLRKK